MLDRDTVVNVPHSVTVSASGRKRVVDPRISVTLQEGGAALTLFFDPATAWTGTAPLLEVRLEPPSSGQPFEPWHLLPRLPLYLQYARAKLAFERDDAAAALRALRQVSSTRRGLSDDFLRLVAGLYEALVAEGEPYPVKALAESQPVDKSTASRWVSAARDRGFLRKTERK